MHRDVVQTVTSTCSLYCVFRSTFSDHVDPVEVGRQQQEILPRWFNGTVAARARLAGTGVRFLDVAYDELVSDPLGIAARILEFAGIEASDDTCDAMRTWLADNRQDKHGSHRYAPDEFAIDVGALRESMTPYRDAFGV